MRWKKFYGLCAETNFQLELKMKTAAESCDMVSHKLRVAICKLRVTSYELKASKQELKFKSASSNPRVTSSTLRVTSLNLLVSSLNPGAQESFNQWKLKWRALKFPDFLRS